MEIRNQYILRCVNLVSGLVKNQTISLFLITLIPHGWKLQN